MLQKTVLFIFAILMLVFSGCTKNDSQTKNQATSNIITLSPIEDANTTIEILKTKEGFKLVKNPNKIVIFDIYATWCAPCRAESAVLTNIQKKFHNDVRVIGLCIEDGISNSKLAAYKQKYHANYTLTNSVNNQKLIDAIAKNLQIGQRFPIPLVAIYKNGKLVNYYAGATEEEFIQSDIKQAMGK